MELEQYEGDESFRIEGYFYILYLALVQKQNLSNTINIPNLYI